jgi:hypothetical protein
MPGKIYILSPGNILSGGVSSLHNLCLALVQNNYQASIFYIDVNEEFIKTVLLSKFNTPRADKIEDNKYNLLIVPETLVNYFKKYPYIGKLVYWLSLKFFFKNSQYYNKLFQNYFLRKLFHPLDYIGGKPKSIEYFKQKVLQWATKKSGHWGNEITHLANSQYTYGFCEKMGAEKFALLYNPLIDEVFRIKTQTERKYQILLGARTPLLLEIYLKISFPEAAVLKIKKLPIQKVYELMSESAIYVDLSVSNRDRAAREAALLGCIVFTSSLGSARFMKDVPIPDFFKIRGSIFNFYKIKCRINSALNNYDKLISEFDLFKKEIMNEKKYFAERVKQAFDLLLNLNKPI